MAALDGYKYPDRDVEEVIEVADILVNEFGEEPSSEETFAQMLGHASKKSGAYKQKLADSRKYGVLPSRGLEPTDLAFRIANPENDLAETKSRFEMFQNIPLFSTLYDHLNGQEPPSEFWRVLTEISDANPAEAKEAATEIRDIYRKMLRCAPDETSESSGEDDENTEDAEVVNETYNISARNPQSKGGILIQVGGDTLHLEEVSVMNLQLATAMLEQKQEQLKRKEPSSTDDSNEEKLEETPEADLSQF